MVSLASLLRKGDSLSLKIPKKSKEVLKPDQFENPSGHLRATSVAHKRRGAHSPDQVRFFTRPFEKSKMVDSIPFNFKNPV